MTINIQCPLCNQANNCCNGLDKNLGICWCTKENFPQEIFTLIPEDQLRKTCICKDCLTKFKLVKVTDRP